MIKGKTGNIIGASISIDGKTSTIIGEAIVKVSIFIQELLE